VKLTKDQIEHSPTLNRDKPVSRQFERAYFGFYGLPVYFGFEPDRIKAGNSAQTRKKRGDPDLRSTHDVSGHHVEASDGEIGHVEDFLIDDETWVIRYLITRDAIRQAPEYKDSPPLTRDQEIALHRHYKRPGYWDADDGGLDDFEVSRRYPGRFLA
jgi:hypothetical protein